MITLQAEGRRVYLRGNTFPIKEAIRAAGGHWDADAKAWWVGGAKRAEVEAAIAKAVPAGASAQQTQREAPGKDATVAGRAEYKDKTYYVAGRLDRSYVDGVSAVTTRDGGKILLYSRDGTLQFWADSAAVKIVKSYDRPQTIARLAEYAERAKTGGGGRLEEGYYHAKSGEVLATGCSRCRQLGRMCRSCERNYE